jgi:hypothetical protein
MTADDATQKNVPGRSNMLPTLALAFALITLCFALLSMILGSRLSTLFTESLKAEKEAVRSEAASMGEIENALKTATVDLKAVQQALETEKAAGNRLRKQLSVVKKDLEKAKANLATADRTITKLKSMPPAESIPALENTPTTSMPIKPSENGDGVINPLGQPESKLADDPVSPPATTQQPGDAPALNEPEQKEIPTPGALADDPKPQAGHAVPPATAPLSSTVSATVTEETIPN